MNGETRRQVDITNDFGFHMRAAFRFVQLCARFQAQIRVFHDGRVADGRSVLDLLALGAMQGARVELEATGPDAEQAAAALCGLIELGFHDRDECLATWSVV
jgi:phosphotransferase system HPr (HPr) family protein